MSVIPNLSPEDMFAADRRLWADLTPEARAQNDRMTELARLHRVIEATDSVTGIRSRFTFAEHFNLGPGWMMLDIDGGHGKLVSSFDLTDAVGADEPREHDPRILTGP
jgi:hypothetical protein